MVAVAQTYGHTHMRKESSGLLSRRLEVHPIVDSRCWVFTHLGHSANHISFKSRQIEPEKDPFASGNSTGSSEYQQCRAAALRRCRKTCRSPTSSCPEAQPLQVHAVLVKKHAHGDERNL